LPALTKFDSCRPINYVDDDVITRDAMAVQRSPAFTMTRMLCNACTASPIIIDRFNGYIDQIESNRDFLTAHRIESDRNEKFGIVPSLV